MFVYEHVSMYLRTYMHWYVYVFMYVLIEFVHCMAYSEILFETYTIGTKKKSNLSTL